MQIGFVTCSRFPNLTEDDQILAQCLSQRNIAVVPVVWDHPDVDWSQFPLCVVRSPWDYYQRPAEFLAWLSRVSEQTSLWNPPDVLRWNLDKQYLIELQDAGLPVLRSVLVKAGTPLPNLSKYLNRMGWDKGAIIKPCVSASGHDVVKVTPETLTEGQTHFERLVGQQDVLIQPYLPAIESEGELSLVYIDGRYAHAVQKTAASGEFKIQEHFGGRIQSIEPTLEALEIAERILNAVQKPMLYARVDLIRNTFGALCLSELEVFEPSLYFQYHPAAADRMAEAIIQKAQPVTVSSSV